MTIFFKKKRSSEAECKCSRNFLNPNCKLHRYDWIDAYLSMISCKYWWMMIVESIVCLTCIVITLKNTISLIKQKTKSLSYQVKNLFFLIQKAKSLHNSVYCSCQKACFHFCIKMYVSLFMWESLFSFGVGKHVFILCRKACSHVVSKSLFHVCVRKSVSISVSESLFPYPCRNICFPPKF